MTRKEEAVMIGEKNLENYPWTKLRTVLTTIFLAVGGLMVAVGIVFWPNPDGIAFGVVCGAIVVLITLVVSLCEYFYDQVPYRIVRGFPKLSVIEFDALGRIVTVLGADSEKHYFKPDSVLYSEKEEKSYVVVSGRLDSPWMRLRLGGDIEDIIVYPRPQKTK